MADQHRRFMRFVAEFEIEVIDPTTAASYTFDWGRDESGEGVMMPYASTEEQMAAAVRQVLSEGLHAGGPQAGFRWLSGSTVPRQRVGDEFVEVTIRAELARRDDGSYPDAS